MWIDPEKSSISIASTGLTASSYNFLSPCMFNIQTTTRIQLGNVSDEDTSIFKATAVFQKQRDQLRNTDSFTFVAVT